MQSKLLVLLFSRKQKVILNGVISSWKPIKSGVPQVSFHRDLRFLIFIIDLPENLICKPKPFIEDESLNADMIKIHVLSI